MKNDMIDVQKRRRRARGGGKRGQIDTEVKKHRRRKREQNRVEKLDRTCVFSSLFLAF